MGHVLKSEEGVGTPQHGPPSGEIDRRRNPGSLYSDSQMEPKTGRVSGIEVVGEEARDGYGNEHRAPQPGGFAGNQPKMHQQKDDDQCDGTDQVGKIGGIQAPATPRSDRFTRLTRTDHL